MKSKLIQVIVSVVILATILVSVKLLLLKSPGEEDNGSAVKNSASSAFAADKQDTGSSAADTTASTAAVKEDEEEKSRIKITASGDILLGRGVEYYLKQAGKDYIYPFEKVAPILKKGDIVFGNLEEAITDNVHGLLNIDSGGKYVLKNEVAAFAGIQYAGFNLLNLANNHILDYYEEGLYDTIDLLKANNIAFAGAGKDINAARTPALITKNGVRVAMLSYTDMAEVVYMGDPQLSFIAGGNKSGVAPRKDIDYIREDINKIRDSVDLLIVSLHWGVEESFEIPAEQREYAHRLIDSGTDIILGHHPHQFQGIEMYKGKPIVYSLGNFIFDQNDPENQEAFILELDYEKDRLISFSATPVRTVNKIRIDTPQGQNAAELLNREKQLCAELDTECTITDDKLVFELN